MWENGHGGELWESYTIYGSSRACSGAGEGDQQEQQTTVRLDVRIWVYEQPAARHSERSCASSR